MAYTFIYLFLLIFFICYFHMLEQYEKEMEEKQRKDHENYIRLMSAYLENLKKETNKND